MVGVAVFGTILATILSSQLPKYMPAELQKAGVQGMSFSMGQLESGNVAIVGDRIKGQLRGTYDKIEAVMTRGDQAAAREPARRPAAAGHVQGHAPGADGNRRRRGGRFGRSRRVPRRGSM